MNLKTYWLKDLKHNLLCSLKEEFLIHIIFFYFLDKHLLIIKDKISYNWKRHIRVKQDKYWNLVCIFLQSLIDNYPLSIRVTYKKTKYIILSASVMWILNKGHAFKRLAETGKHCKFMQQTVQRQMLLKDKIRNC